MPSDISCPACGRELRVDSRRDRALIPCAGCGTIVTALQTPQGFRLQLPPGARILGKSRAASTPPSGPSTPPAKAPANVSTGRSTAVPLRAAKRWIGTTACLGALRNLFKWRAERSKTAVVGLAAMVLIFAVLACWWSAQQPALTVAATSVSKDSPRNPETKTSDVSKPPAEKSPDSGTKSGAPPVKAPVKPPDKPPVKPPVVETPPPPQRVALSTRDLIRLVEPSVCRIRTRTSIGSGFVVGPHLVCTNEHVLGLEDEEGWVVEFPARNGRRFGRVTLAYVPDGIDLALLRVEDLPEDFRPLQVVTRADLHKGDHLVVIGSPGGMENVVTEGIVGSFQELNRQTFIQLSISVNPGNSGGPALNDFGDVAGVVTLKAEQEGIGMAIPGDEVQRAMQELARLSAGESRRLLTRWKARQAGTKLLVGSREGLELLMSPSSDPQQFAKDAEAWQRTYRDGPSMSQRLRDKLLKPDKHGLFVRLEQLFNESRSAANQPESDPAALKSNCDRLVAQADVLERELKAAYGLAETSRRKESRIGGGK